MHATKRTETAGYSEGLLRLACTHPGFVIELASGAQWRVRASVSTVFVDSSPALGSFPTPAVVSMASVVTVIVTVVAVVALINVPAVLGGGLQRRDQRYRRDAAGLWPPPARPDARRPGRPALGRRGQPSSVPVRVRRLGEAAPRRDALYTPGAGHRLTRAHVSTPRDAFRREQSSAHSGPRSGRP